MRLARRDEPAPPDRVFIIGGAGSGKTALARALAARWSLPHYQMDLGEADEALEHERWLIEGAQLWDIDRYLTNADLIVWLELKPTVTIPRILTRHMKLSLRGCNPHRGLRLLARFVREQPAYYHGPPRRPIGPEDFSQTRAGTERTLQPYSTRVIQLSTPRDVHRWLRAADPTTP